MSGLTDAASKLLVLSARHDDDDVIDAQRGLTGRDMRTVIAGFEDVSGDVVADHPEQG